MLVVGCLIAAVGCSDDGGGKTLLTEPAPTTTAVEASTTTLPIDDPAASKPWTVFVYMAADNNLEQAAVIDIAEMQAGVTDDMNLVVLVDRSPEFSTDPIEGIGDFTGARLLHITPTGIVDLGLRGDAALTDPAVLVQMGTKVFTEFPAEHTAMVFWDHAAGWHGFASDDQSGGSMDPDEIGSALQQVLAAAGLPSFSIVAFDTCLMGQYEVAEAVAPATDLMLASEESVPAHGLDYASLGDAVSGDGANFGSVMIGGYTRQARDYGQDASITMSLLDLTSLGGLRSAIDGLAQAVASAPAAGVEFLKAVDGSMQFGFIPADDVNFNYRDLGQLATRLKGSATLGTAAAAVDAAVSKTVIMHVEGSGYAGARGISVYAPLSIESFDTRYNDLSTTTAWSAVLDAAYNGGADSVVGQDTSFLTPATAVFEDGMFSIGAQVDPAAVANITSVGIFYGAYVPAGDGFPELCLILGQMPGQVLDAATGVVGGQIPLIQLGLSGDGGGSGLLGVFAPVPSDDGSVLLLSVPMLYIPPGGTVDTAASGYLVLAVDDSGAVVQRRLVLQQDNGTLGEVTPDPAGTLQTVVQQLGADGSLVPVPSEVYTTPGSLPADLANIDIIAIGRAPGDGSPLGSALAVGVVTVDAGGTTQFTFTQYTG